jgi:Kef-type K+ transport system membrane component KefB
LTVYGALWRALPGPVWVRLIMVIALIAVVLYVLGTWVFPWVQSFVDTQDVTVEE